MIYARILHWLYSIQGKTWENRGWHPCKAGAWSTYVTQLFCLWETCFEKAWSLIWQGFGPDIDTLVSFYGWHKLGRSFFTFLTSSKERKPIIGLTKSTIYCPLFGRCIHIYRSHNRTIGWGRIADSFQNRGLLWGRSWRWEGAWCSDSRSTYSWLEVCLRYIRHWRKSWWLYYRW